MLDRRAVIRGAVALGAFPKVSSGARAETGESLVLQHVSEAGKQFLSIFSSAVAPNEDEYTRAIRVFQKNIQNHRESRFDFSPYGVVTIFEGDGTLILTYLTHVAPSNDSGATLKAHLEIKIEVQRGVIAGSIIDHSTRVRHTHPVSDIEFLRKVVFATYKALFEKP